ncbi:hypothetical protein LAZ67_1003112 [Cordylochernes scorpioides]|uniref:PDZ domain-containing protein n=1 Tax=Cordylochernes scorpioides TaxID=51811 RepID=A0ABY6JXQ1_9ARAC|nr:hypothetical protein LAZ67_1003112 [Cordylochernes scorpioides]
MPFVIKTGNTTQWQADLAPKEMSASDRNRCHVQPLLTWSTNAVSLDQEPLQGDKLLGHEVFEPSWELVQGDDFTYSEAKIKEGIFVGPQIRELQQDGNFQNSLNEVEAAAWNSFRKVCKIFLGSVKVENYRHIVNDLLLSYKALGCNMSLKIHFLHSHLDFFPDNLGAVSDEHGERFHQDISSMEKRYQGKWSPGMLADYCWTLKRDLPQANFISVVGDHFFRVTVQRLARKGVRARSKVATVELGLADHRGLASCFLHTLAYEGFASRPVVVATMIRVVSGVIGITQKDMLDVTIEMARESPSKRYTSRQMTPQVGAPKANGATLRDPHKIQVSEPDYPPKQAWTETPSSEMTAFVPSIPSKLLNYMDEELSSMPILLLAACWNTAALGNVLCWSCCGMASRSGSRQSLPSISSKTRLIQQNTTGHEEGLTIIRMKADEQGRFGFNVKGGADQNLPILVSRVAPNTPADMCVPRLNEGDQVLVINGREVAGLPHDQEIKDLESENKAIVESKNIHGLKLFQQEVNERKISLNQVINTLLESELDDTQYDDYSKAKKDIFNMLVSIEEALSLIETKENTHSDKQLPESNVNLPKINLPIFNGDSANWLSFREIFNSTINSNQTLTEIQKFQYLNASVKGPAEKLIRGFPISDKNYQQAWDTLCNRFNNRRELAFSQINKIFSIRPLKSISAGSLYEILDVCNEGIRNLSVLGLEKNTLTDLILINFFEKRIGEALRKEWELTLQNEEYPTFENFVNFLEKHARSLQGMRIPLFQEQKTSSKNMMAHGLYVNKGQNCILCHQIHKLNDCQRFINLPLPKKWELVKKHKLCQNCLRANHEISKCLITSRCKNCKQNHHTLLHGYNSEPSIPQPTTSQEMLISTNTICNAMPLETETNILLSTALIKVKAKDGSFVLCRALVDNGSQISLISEQCCHKLGLEKRKNSYTLKGVGDIVVNRTTSQVEIEFTPHHNDQLFSARAFVVGRVTADLPNFQIQSADFPHLENLLLADPEFYVTKPIDLILGADTFVEIILGHKTDLKHHPIALNTKLGWLVSGRIHSTIKSNTSVINHCTTELDSSIRKFWELEDVPISKAQLGTKNACEILFKSNLKRDIEGRYSVNLPFKSTPNLGDSRSQALEKGLQENPSKSEDNSSKSEENLSRSEDNPSKSEEIPSKSKKSRISQIIPKIKPPPYYRRKRQLPAEKTSWDEPIESDIKSNWNKFQTQLLCLKEIKIPRYLNSSSSEIEELQLHGFCDASLNAYSAVFYLKTRFKIQKIKINLITSKTKVAPLKTITIPRLELSAALLLAQLNQVILESFPFQPDKTFLWTDSQICIDWIRSDASRWKAFVSSRVSSIQNLTQITDWFHVSSQDNPADCASRGIMPQDLVNHRIWWRGPIWLQENNVRYIPSSPTQVNLNIIQEEVGEGQVLDQTTLIQNSETMLNLEFIVRYSTMTKLIRITAWCWRFYYNCLLFDPIRQKGPLTTRELTKAIQVLVKSIQQVEFCTEIKLLKSNKQLPLSNKLTSLNPFLDTQGLLRVGGRLKYSYLNENQNFPLLQPKPPRQESLIKNLLTQNADIPEAIDENQEDSSILETTFIIEDEESNKDIGTPKIEISEVSVIDKSEGKYSKEPVVSAEALDKKELCHDDSAHLNVVEADLNRPKEATSGIINVSTEANESASKEKAVPVEIVDTSTKYYLQSSEKAKLSRWKPIDSLCLEDIKESEDDDENYSSSAYIEWPEILKKEVLRPEALEKAVNLEDFEKAAESRQLSKEHLEESTEQGSCIKAESKTWEDPIESDLAAAESDNPAVPERELANESENLIQDSPQSDTQRWKLIPLPFKQ